MATTPHSLSFLTCGQIYAQETHQGPSAPPGSAVGAKKAAFLPIPSGEK